MKIAAGWFRERRGMALGVVVGAVGVGSAFPHLLAWLGAGLPWRSLVAASSVMALAGAALVAFAVKDGPYVSASAPFDRHALRIVLSDRGTRLAMLGYLGHMWELYAMWTWIAVFAAASLGAAAGTRGSAVAFVTIASGSIGCVVAGFWADRWGKARIAGAAMLASAACALGSPLFYGAPLGALLALAVIWGFTVVADSAQFSALVTDARAAARSLGYEKAWRLAIGDCRLKIHGLAIGDWRFTDWRLATGQLMPRSNSNQQSSIANP